MSASDHLSGQQFSKYSPAVQDPQGRTRGGPNWDPSPGSPASDYRRPIDVSQTFTTLSKVHRIGGRGRKPPLHWMELHNHTTEPSFEGWDRKEPLGQLVWDSKTGRVNAMHTKEEYRGLGVASQLWEHANRLADLGAVVRPQHSNNRTTGGDAFARSVGGRLPKNKKAKSDWHRQFG